MLKTNCNASRHNTVCNGSFNMCVCKQGLVWVAVSVSIWLLLGPGRVNNFLSAIQAPWQRHLYPCASSQSCSCSQAGALWAVGRGDCAFPGISAAHPHTPMGVGMCWRMPSAVSEAGMQPSTQSSILLVLGWVCSLVFMGILCLGATPAALPGAQPSGKWLIQSYFAPSISIFTIIFTGCLPSRKIRIFELPLKEALMTPVGRALHSL